MKIKSIKLTAFLNSGAILGSLGDIVEVTAENEKDCLALIKEKGAHAHLVEKIVAKPEPAGELDTDDESETGGESDGEGEGLADVDDTDSIEALEIAPRYKAALKEAGMNTVADVKAHADLASVPGLNANVAKKIAKLIE